VPLIRMETDSKERLTGALLVVLAVIIVVPQLLSGGGDVRRAAPQVQNPEDGAPLQTFDIPLSGSSSVPAVPRDLPAAAAAEIAAVPPPVTSVEAPQAAAPVEPQADEPTRMAEKPAEKPAEKSPEKPAEKVAAAANQPQQARPASAAEPAKPAPSGKWWVQIGVFASRDNAQSLAQKLRAAGFTIDVSQMRSNGKELYRVRAGPAADKPAAVAMQSRLDAAGQKKSSLVAP
jgi:DedD protein